MQQHWKGVGRYATVGLELALSILLGAIAGAWLDRRLQTGNWLTFVGFLLGALAGFRALWRALQQANREAEESERREREARKRYHKRDNAK